MTDSLSRPVVRPYPPLGKRRIYVDPETKKLVLLSVPLLSFPPSSKLFGRNPSNVIRVALGYARRIGEDPEEVEVVTNGVEPFKVDTLGLFEEANPKVTVGAIRSSLRWYLKEGQPTSNGLSSRGGTPCLNPMCGHWFEPPQRSLLAEIAINALANRKTAEVEAVETIEEAMRRSLSRLPSKEEGTDPLPVHLRVDSSLYEEFRNRASLTGYDADTLLWTATREVVNERRGKT
jgi:hypothetical protein